jgi:hypothetical protein
VLEGSGVNPLTLSQAGEPRLGQSWQLDLDCSGHGAGLATVSGWSRAMAGLLLPAGELLIDPTSLRLYTSMQPHAGGPVGVSIAVPADLSLVNLLVHSQGACSGAPGLRLANALGSQVGF